MVEWLEHVANNLEVAGVYLALPLMRHATEEAERMRGGHFPKVCLLLLLYYSQAHTLSTPYFSYQNGLAESPGFHLLDTARLTIKVDGQMSADVLDACREISCWSVCVATFVGQRLILIDFNN